MTSAWQPEGLACPARRTQPRRRDHRIAQRLLALTAAIWHDRATSQPVTRSLIAYDH
jgi:hypothetical protein